MTYSHVAALLHWLMALLVILILVLGLFGDALESIISFSAITLHKSLGMTVFLLTLFRGFWRIGHRPPPLPETTPKWQIGASHAVHFLIYALMLGLPLSGYIFGAAGPYPMQFFGLDVPKIAVGEAMGETAHSLHEIGGLTMAGLVVLHMGAAFYHHFVQKDELINRMRPWRAA